jgi:hypothetical protein
MSVNKITKAERESLILKAALLLRAGVGQRAAERSLQESEGVSKQRARTAVAKAIMRQNRPQNKKGEENV